MCLLAKCDDAGNANRLIMRTRKNTSCLLVAFASVCACLLLAMSRAQNAQAARFSSAAQLLMSAATSLSPLSTQQQQQQQRNSAAAAATATNSIENYAPRLDEDEDETLLMDDLMDDGLDTAALCGLRNEPSSSGDHLYIVSGDEVDDDLKWPWAVAIFELDPLSEYQTHICGGSLISDSFVMTAAHCVHQSRFDLLGPSQLIVKVANARLDAYDEHHFIEEVFVHPDYIVDRKAADIALLKISSPSLPKRARPICLPSYSAAKRFDFTDNYVTVIGWGYTGPRTGTVSAQTHDTTLDEQLMRGDASRYSTALREAQLRVTNTDECKRNYSKIPDIDWLKIDQRFMCAMDPEGKRDTCQGDSGGPLMWTAADQPRSTHSTSSELQHQQHEQRYYQLGVVSFGQGCADTRWAGVYTRVSHYMPWISRVVKQSKRHQQRRRGRRRARSVHAI